METQLFEGIRLFFVCWLLTRFEPIKMLSEALPGSLFWNILKLIFSCLTCLLFWMTLIATGDITFASIMAFIGFWYDKLLGPLEDKIRLK